MQFQMLGTRLLASARHVQHQAEQFPAYIFNRRVAGCYTTCIDIHQVMPAACQIGACRDLDDGYLGQAIWRTPSCGEHMQIDTGGDLQRAADEVPRGCCPKIRPFCFTFSPGDSTPEIAELPDLMMEPIAFSTIFDNP